MIEFEFRVTQPLLAFYEGKVKIQADNEEEARMFLKNMPQNLLEQMVTEWDQNTENASGDGDIEIHELLDVEDWEDEIESETGDEY